MGSYKKDPSSLFFEALFPRLREVLSFSILVRFCFLQTRLRGFLESVIWENGNLPVLGKNKGLVLFRLRSMKREDRTKG